MALGLGVVALATVLALAVGLVASGLATRFAAANAADAAALAAAPVTFRPFGADGTPRAEAARFAARNGARLLRCRCPVDRSWDARTVEVTVARRIDIPIIGAITIRASSRATFEPLLLVEGG